MGLTLVEIVSDLETIIVLVLLEFNFIYLRSHHILTLLRSRFRDSVKTTLAPEDDNGYCGNMTSQYQRGVVVITVKLVLHYGEKLRCVQQEQLRT